MDKVNNLENVSFEQSIAPKFNSGFNFIYNSGDWYDEFVQYSNHLNTRLFWYSNGRFVPGCQMVWYSNGGLITGLKKSVCGPKCPVYQVN